jgi:hypothetical protein
MLIYPRDQTVQPPGQVIPVQRLSQAPSRLPAQCRAGQLLAGDNLDEPANNLHNKKM